ncbi:PspC domain-containing protein [Nocardioides terrisoli]|uniref:PspC domain-containing protein n=1 Tax=Nocardioides terrisoli TaxID=3388267 RepID=UPI00287BA2C9|nr:PspC domain-containing protein [Nocardioides marmorisolisilvae]
MSTTQDQGGTRQEPADDGPQVNREQLHDLDRLRRSSTDRYIAGVAGGIGRHFGIDPTIIRVVLAVACFFGGAGLILYAAVWLLVPEDDHARAPIPVGGEARRVLLIAAAVIAALALVGNSWGGFGWHFAWPLVVIAVILAVVVGGHRRVEERRADAASGPGATTPGPSDTTIVPPTAWRPPPPSYRPKRPERVGLVLFWPTLALIAVGLGALGIYDIDHHVATGAWAAVPLGIIGVMLVVGAFVGRPGGLILLGLLALPALAVTTAVGSAGHWEARTVHYAPASAAQVQDDYRISNGSLVVDLSTVSDPTALAGRQLDLRMNAGEIRVVLPPGVRASVDASLGFAGDVQVGSREQSGFGPELHRIVPGGGASASAPLMTLDVHGHVGHIQIERYRGDH